MKLKKLLLPIFATLMLTSCVMYNGIPQESSSSTTTSQSTSASSPTTSTSGGGSTTSQEPQPTGMLTYFLVLPSNGQIDGVSGKNIENMYLENAFEMQAEAGTKLPANVTVTSGNGKFAGWTYYSTLLAPGTTTVVDSVLPINMMIYYAKFDNSGSPVDPTPSGTTVTRYFTNGQYYEYRAFDNPYIYMWDDLGNKNADWPGVKLTNPVKNDIGQDVYAFTYKTDEYTHFIVADWNGTSTVDQTVDCDLASFTSGNDNVYLKDGGTGARQLGFAKFTPAA